MAMVAPRAGSGRDAQQVRLGQRVAEDALERGAGGGQRGAGDEGEDDAGQAEVEQEARRPVGEVAGGVGAVADEAAKSARRPRRATGPPRRRPRRSTTAATSAATRTAMTRR